MSRAADAEFESMVRGYLVARADGYPHSPSAIVALARELRFNGGDPVRLLLGLDVFADQLGEYEAILDLRAQIGAEENAPAPPSMVE
ncbi:hypothetical protein F3087_27805 [Nocardia colli]|uniref:Uncharacterized protein n=1 Tax=Nocardia colli TaxID=2545717 RepID=A0A5N0E907_9NOCA|nr:hypothetical protein [Nocardia colli]KAA8885446.1 hypothetical protein F3087_27805 [Nocardia colli]